MSLRTSEIFAALTVLVVGSAACESFAQNRGDEAAPAAADARSLTDADRKALEAMQGIWTPVAVDGDEKDRDFLTLTIEGDRMAWPPNPGDQILIDASQSPPRIDFVSGKPGQLGYLANIFKIDGDRLTLCRLPATRVPRDVSRVQGPGPKRLHPSEGQLVEFRRVEPLPGPMAVIGFDLDDADDAQVDFDGEERAAIAIGPVVLVWDLKTNRLVERWTDPDGRPPAKAIFLPGGKRLAISFEYGRNSTTIWNLETGKEEARLLGNGAIVSPNGESLLTWNDQGTLRLFDPESLELRSESGSPGDPPGPIAFHPDGSRFAINPGGSWLTAFDSTGELTAKETVESSLGREARVFDLAFDPTGERLVTLEHDSKRNRRFFVRDAKTLTVEKEFEVSSTIPKSFAFAPDGKTLFVGSSYGVIDQVDANDGLMLRSYRPFVPGTSPLDDVTTVRISSGGSFLAATHGNVCCLWDLRKSDSPVRGEPVRWPARSPEAISKEIERTERHREFPFAEAFIDLDVDVEAGKADISIRERPTDFIDAEGKPTLSWRVRLLEPAGKKFVASAMRPNEPWDSEWNRRAIPLAADVFGWSGVEKTKTTWQLATGPTTAYDGTGEKIVPESPGCKIFLIETAPERAVVWSEPRDFVFDPKSPKAGLPEDGFHVVDWEGFSYYVRGDIPDDLLRRMFTAKGTIRPEETEPYKDTHFQRLYRP